MPKFFLFIVFFLSGYLFRGNEEHFIQKVKTSTVYILQVIKDSKVDQEELERMKQPRGESGDESTVKNEK